MNYFKRVGIGVVGSAVVLVLYTLAANSWSTITLNVFALLVATGIVCGLIASSLAAAIVRSTPWAMMLLAQVLTILIVGAVWQS